jgi:uncharacterized protein (DUF1800 family)
MFTERDTARSTPHRMVRDMAVDLAHHVVRRFTYGSTPELLDLVRARGVDRWFEEQLRPDSVADDVCEGVIASHPGFYWGQLRSYAEVQGVRDSLSGTGLPPDSMFQNAKRNLNYARRLLSTRQVFETMVEFWSEHFNINDASGKGAGLLNAYGLDWEVSVVRAHALTSFPRMLRAAVYHPAMIVWLDGEYSRKSSPNENFARELLELYTVTPDAGYTQDDVVHAARLFSGLRGPWQRTPSAPRAGMVGMHAVDDQTFIDVSQQHFGSFRVMGWSGSASTPSGVVAAIDGLVAYLAGHPATARNVATKLARRYVADAPSPQLIGDLARHFSAVGGDTPGMLRALVAHGEFRAAVGRKLKRPTEDLISLARALQLVPDPAKFGWVGRSGGTAAVNWGFDQLLGRLGHQHARWPLPDGYPDTEEYWNDSASHVARWYAHQILVGGAAASTAGMQPARWGSLVSSSTPATVPDIVDAVASRLLQRTLSTESRAAVIAAASRTRGAVTESTRDATCALVAFLVTSLPEWVER